MNTQKLQIKEKTALLDKAVFGNILILGFDDMKKLLNDNIVEMTNAKVRYITASGQEFNRLLIESDGIIDRMVAGSKLMCHKRLDYCSLETTVKNSEVGNLACYTLDEYVGQLITIQEHLKNCYGIDADFSNPTVKELEINKTFKLVGNFEDYHRPINLIMSNLPSYLKNQMGYKKVAKGIIEYQTYYATSKKSNKSNRYLLFKIYNKTKAVEHIILITDSYMRVELRLVGAEKVKKALKTNRLAELSDQIINDYFDKQIESMIVKPFEKWQKDRDKYLVNLMREQRDKDIRHWQTNVLRILQNEEIAQKRPVLLDIEELIPLVDKLDISSKRRSEVKRNFRKQSAKYESVFCNNDDKKLKEIIVKLTAKDSAKEVNPTAKRPNIDGMQKTA